MLPSTDKALVVSVTVLLVGGIVTASAAPALAASQSSTAEDANNLQLDQHEDSGWNARLSSDAVVWQNQRAYFNGAEIVNNASIQPVARASTQARTFEIRRVANDSMGTAIEQFTVNETGAAVIDMSGYEPGEYVIAYEDMPVSVDDGEADFASDVSDASFGVAIQNLSVSFDPEQTEPGTSTDFEIDSNRDDSYVIQITADGLHQAQVEAIMDEGEPFANSSVENGTILRFEDNFEVQLFEAPIDPGQYEFQVSVPGASASDNATLTIGDPEGLNETGNESAGPGTPAGNDTAGPGTDEDMFTDEPGNETDTPTDSDTPTESEPAGEESPTTTAAGDETGTETTTSTGPGFGLIAAAIGLLGAGLLATRRRD